jgi:hypothetical protein
MTAALHHSLVAQATNPIIRWEWIIEEWDQV